MEVSDVETACALIDTLRSFPEDWGRWGVPQKLEGLELQLEGWLTPAELDDYTITSLAFSAWPDAARRRKTPETSLDEAVRIVFRHSISSPRSGLSLGLTLVAIDDPDGEGFEVRAYAIDFGAMLPFRGIRRSHFGRRFTRLIVLPDSSAVFLESKPGAGEFWGVEPDWKTVYTWNAGKRQPLDPPFICGDIDRDGDPDLVFGYRASRDGVAAQPLDICLRGPNGRFENVGDRWIEYVPAAARVASQEDLPAEWGETIAVARGFQEEPPPSP